MKLLEIFSTNYINHYIYFYNTMEVSLEKIPKNPIIIEGFPGLGYVSTIAMEYLIENLKAKPIGKIVSDKLAPIATIHKGELRRPFEIFYDNKNNLILLHAITDVNGLEWKIADTIIQFSKKVKAKEVISIEGVNAPFTKKKISSPFYHSNKEAIEKKLKKLGYSELKEGAVLGVTGSLMLRAPKKLPLTYIFAETTSKLPDSRAAAEIVKVLNNYLALKIDVRPLLKKAEETETKIKAILKEGLRGKKDLAKKSKDLSYVG